MFPVFLKKRRIDSCFYLSLMNLYRSTVWLCQDLDTIDIKCLRDNCCRVLSTIFLGSINNIHNRVRLAF
jgi:hypothetical protein